MARISQYAGLVNRRYLSLSVVFFFILLFAVAYIVSLFNITRPKTSIKSVAEFFAEFPMRFQTNGGNFTDDVKYFSKGYQYDLLFMEREVLLNLYSSENPADDKSLTDKSTAKDITELSQISLAFIGNNVNPQIKGLNPTVASNASLHDKSGLQADGFTELKYSNVYPGVDVYFYGKQKQLFYEFILSANATPDNVKMKVDGIDASADVEIDIHGNVLVACRGKKMLINRPRVYRLVRQQKQAVQGYFYVTPRNEIRFKAVGALEAV